MHASGDLGDPYFYLTDEQPAIDAGGSHATGNLGTLGGTISSAPVPFPAWRTSLSVDVDVLPGSFAHSTYLPRR